MSSPPVPPTCVYRRSGIHDPALRQGYEACRRATRATGEIEYAVSLLLPPPLRIATWALYGALGTVDGLADTAAPSDGTSDATGDARVERLEAWVSAFDADLRDGRGSDPVRQALIHTMLAWNLPPGFLHTLFEELRQDIRGRDFATWQEWRRYSTLVNTPFVLRAGSLLLRVAGLSAEPEAIAAGVPDAAVAWQTAVDGVYLTDALVDLSDDLGRGHVPLPQEALDEAGVRRADLLARRSTPAFEEMVRRLAGRARGWLDRTPVPPVLHPAVGIALGAYTDLYRLRLKAVADAPAALLHRRPPLPRSARLRLLLPARARAALAWGLFPFPVRPCPLPEPAPADAPEGLAGAEEVRSLAAQRRPIVPPTPHPSGARPPQLPAEAMPRHVAVVMDGNGRWATARGLPRTDGHRAGADALIDVVHGALEAGLKYLTVYAFSTENWKRPADELHALMYEIPQLLRRLTDDAEPLDVRVRWAGVRSRLPADVVETLVEVERATRDCTGLTLTVCVNYGGRAEITAAAARLAQEVAAGRIDPGAVSEHAFARYLHVPELPDVDLLLRTGGDQRTSNFLPWQATYAELLFLDTPWPEIDRRDLWRAIEQYARRTRRYGSVPRIPVPAQPVPVSEQGAPAQ
ncbi:di-trans,poly-cis-decaprenylcistransferase [Streptomyces sp. ISL-22]|uniref:polyprenyl diphosphate synthase n=1 Tax=unclassified Streptomyces TaxID=2593676 RepID=UPI001BE85F98|nr:MULTISPECIES: polyprenyl diphosphate synthase [unclassified Streptomyces]MBT2423390.1 di-trans,poly-cis-decaprenylcistransferase [Streptomyces sp. ISL-24]MBT2438173.1 di-trans,poly-cis-decaprenylcistransferase [Streptomyces sp. ISL-22]